MIAVYDDFLASFDQVEGFNQNAQFENIENPYDGVVYPLINKGIPDDITDSVVTAIESAMGRDITVNAAFMRRSPEDVHVPHVAHTDKAMGDYSLMLYITDGDGGTAFLRHKASGMTYQPESQEFVDVAVRDQNNLSAWAVVDMVPIKPNRAVIFDAGLFHCALPVGGFGEGNSARTVLTVFFS